MYRFAALVFLSFLLLASCGEKLDELKKTTENIKEVAKAVKDAPEKASKFEENLNRQEKIQAERKAKGDTLALNYKELQKFFPEIDGWVGPKLSGESINMQEFSYSNAEAEYQKDESSLSIQLVDYNENYGMLTGLAFWMGGYSRENDQGFERTTDLGFKDVFALEQYSNDSKEAELTVAAGYRFLITISCDDQENTNFVKSVAKKMDLKKLATL